MPDNSILLTALCLSDDATNLPTASVCVQGDSILADYLYHCLSSLHSENISFTTCTELNDSIGSTHVIYSETSLHKDAIIPGTKYFKITPLIKLLISNTQIDLLRA